LPRPQRAHLATMRKGLSPNRDPVAPATEATLCAPRRDNQWSTCAQGLPLALAKGHRFALQALGFSI
jgi:hypothetical protein